MAKIELGQFSVTRIVPEFALLTSSAVLWKKDECCWKWETTVRRLSSLPAIYPHSRWRIPDGRAVV